MASHDVITIIDSDDEEVEVVSPACSKLGNNGTFPQQHLSGSSPAHITPKPSLKPPSAPGMTPRQLFPSQQLHMRDDSNNESARTPPQTLHPRSSQHQKMPSQVRVINNQRGPAAQTPQAQVPAANNYHDQKLAEQGRAKRAKLNEPRPRDPQQHRTQPAAPAAAPAAPAAGAPPPPQPAPPPPAAATPAAAPPPPNHQNQHFMPKELFRQLNAMHAQLSGARDTINALQLREMVDKADKLHAHIKRPREAVADGQLFATITECGEKLAQSSAASGAARRPADLVTALRAIYSKGAVPTPGVPLAAGQFDWERAGADVAHLLHWAPSCSHMLGPLDAVQRARKAPAQRRPRAELGAAVRPEDGSKVSEGQDKQETDHIAEELLRVLGESGSVGLGQLVLNHQSFAQTVENLFSLSFLVRDGLARFSQAQGGQVVVSAVAQQRRQRGDAGAQQQEERLQFVMSLNMADWEQIKRRIPASECLMQHRQPYQQHLAQQQAGAAAP